MARGALTLALAALAALAARAAGILVNVPAHDDECFFEGVEAGNKLTGSYEVVSGGLLDVDCIVTGPNGEQH
jgi:p24 family protein beta-1